MKILFSISVAAMTLLSCSGTNGEDAPTQEELQSKLNKLMKPKVEKDVVLKPDTTLGDSSSTDPAEE